MNFRTDIQALRGLAVLFVVLHHAKLGLLGAGYLGVDIFFVISGFLITGIVKRGIERSDFSFAQFYFRRAKRLLPAAYVTFFISSLLSAIFLDFSELKDFSAQLIGALTFTSNIVLWQQVGYFENASELKPLLHIWSLSLEEQYYLFVPAALVIIPRRFWLIAFSSFLIFSLGLCFVAVQLKPVVAFYLLPTRAWELGIGSLAALALNELNNSKKAQLTLSIFLLPSIIALIVIPILPIGKYVGVTAHPGIDAFLICIATVFVILRNHQFLNKNWISHALAKVGDFSYSLYLVHWVVFAFVNNAYIKPQSIEIHEIALAISFVLGFLLYRCVELPFRRVEIKMSPKVVVATLTITFILLSIPFAINFLRPQTAIDYKEAQRPNFGFDMACEFTENFTPKDECRNSDNPTVLVWGDSFAMHLIEGIITTTNAGVTQATLSKCGPFFGLSPMDNMIYNRSWAEKCLAFNDSVFDYVNTTSSIKVIVMSSPFIQFLVRSEEDNNGKIVFLRSLESIDGKLIEREPSISGAVDAMQRTVDKLRKLGKRIVIVAPPPSSNFNIGRCIERKAKGMLILGTNTENDCDVSIDTYHEKQASVFEFLERVENELKVPVVYFNDLLCSESSCITTIDGVGLYRDKIHLSYDGSRVIAQKMDLGNLLQKIAN